MSNLNNNEKLEICNLIVHTQIPFRYKLDLDKSISFGTEIEFENADFDKVKFELSQKSSLARWQLVDDSSVMVYGKNRIGGGEVLSPILHDNMSCWRQLKSVCKLIRRNIGLNLGRSAAHIHIGANILEHNEKYIANLIELWTAYEHVIYRFAYGDNEMERRSLPTYASPVAPYFYEGLLHLKKDGISKHFKNIYDFFDEFHAPNALNNGINFKNCSVDKKKIKNTIEVRCPNGTLDETVWQNNINFFIKLMLYAKSENYDSELMEYKIDNFQRRKLQDYREIYFDDAIELSNLIFDDEKERLYFLRQYLKINNRNFETIKVKIIENK